MTGTQKMLLKNEVVLSSEFGVKWIKPHRIQGFKGSRDQVKDFENKHLNPRILRPSNPSGITLIEVILVMVIIGILAAIVLPKINFSTTSYSASVYGAAYMVASDIRYTQESAMANRVSKSIVFTSGSTTYTFNPTSTLDPSGRLPEGVTMNTTQTITFNSLGEPTTGGGTSVTVTGGGQTKTISVVSYTGKVNIT
jgi:prepilin-type N-terminal cleavage/methylation domain-containing protein